MEELTPEMQARVHHFHDNIGFTPLIATPEILEKEPWIVKTITLSNGEFTGTSFYNENRAWSTTPDAIRIYGYDEKGFGTGSGGKLYVFDVDPSIRSHIFTLLSLSQSPSPTALSSLLAADKSMLHSTSPPVSAITSPLLRTLLMSTALRAYDIRTGDFPRPVPDHPALIAHLAVAGAPHFGQLHDPMKSIREYIESGGAGGPLMPMGLEAKLVRSRWLKAGVSTRGGELLSQCRDVDGKDPQGARELFDAILEDQRARTLEGMVAGGSVEMVRYALGEISVGSVSKSQASEVLCEAVEKGGWRGRGREVVEMVLDWGADPNVAGCLDTSRFPLHRAVEAGDAEVVGVLLERGARMLATAQGMTPLMLAERKVGRGDGAEDGGIVKLLEEWLGERGLPRDYRDEVIVEEV